MNLHYFKRSCTIKEVYSFNICVQTPLYEHETSPRYVLWSQIDCHVALAALHTRMWTSGSAACGLVFQYLTISFPQEEVN